MWDEGEYKTMNYHYKGVPGWFPDENANTLERLIKEHSVKTVFEIGAYQGRSSIFFGEMGCDVLAFDPFKEWEEGKSHGVPEDFYGLFKENVRKAGLEGKVEGWAMTSRQGAWQKNDDMADLVYIDGAHDFKSVVEDIVLWQDKARVILCGDDYDENWPDVVKAVDMFVPDKVVEGRVWYSIIKNKAAKV